MTGKQAFSFYNRKTGKSVRLVLRARPREMTREESFEYSSQLHGQRNVRGQGNDHPPSRAGKDL